MSREPRPSRNTANQRKRALNTTTRTIALVTGILFVITFLGSIPALILYDPVLHDPNYIVGAGADWRVTLGAFLEVITGVANVGTAVVLFPILRLEHETLAIGYVASRIIESTFIVIGVFSLLSIVTLRQHFAGASGADAATLVIAGRSLVAVHDWTFLLGPGLLSGAGTGMMLGYMMYRTGLVPRGMTLLGLVGGPLVSASGILVLFGVYEQLSLWSAIATIPEFFWELSLGIWLIVKGFNASPITAGYERQLAVGTA
jgi:hypothetical protein